ncbi:MAG: helix-turn-helix transcriptional regulator [Prevotellaceae bacterium]|nr:helix-turn-helix transcriptional regulator [Prevotellaceae bacterium]
MDIIKIFAERFKTRRMELGYNQVDLANILDINRSTIASYEKGYIMPTASKLPEIANVLSVSVGYLLGETDFLNEREAIYDFERKNKDGYIIHDLERIFEDLKQQILFDDKLNFKDKEITEIQKELIINQLDNILKIISL